MQGQLRILAIAAIATTFIGSFFALQSVFDDVLEGAKPKSTPTNPQQQGRAAPDGSGVPREGAPPTSWKDTRWKRRLVAAGMISIPSMAIASTSPTVFLSAIDFAGSYPVVLLWGLTPPLLALRLRKARRRSEPSSSAPVAPPVSSAGPDAWLRLLALVSGLSLAHTFIHSFIHTYIHTYIHACIHAYIHTYRYRYISVTCTFLHGARGPVTCLALHVRLRGPCEGAYGCPLLAGTMVLTCALRDGAGLLARVAPRIMLGPLPWRL